ncbi:thioredoxin family protein [Salisediminibacterium beveridgei]|uniref:Thioredoxin-like fold domain-containing protein n=1 Tax=Salisediminibacterium beveridgei TaxID=632773 RepID=A0A1D7QTP9_9BACI|nr:thioredoxin family protein [Salisediminibacterium beveridgei]AOM82394.1 hypothetical protein BBEV_1025 [Salisediminibacterium beveridgei]
MNIQVYVNENIKGRVFEQRVKEVIKELGIEADVLISSKRPECASHVFYSPALIIDQKVVATGKLLSRDEIVHHFM